MNDNLITTNRVPVATDKTRRLGIGLIALGAGVAVNSLLGPLVADAIDYPVSDTMRNQTTGLDAAGLVVVAPLLILVGVLTLRGHRAAAVLALGPTTYTAYMFAQYIAGPDHLHYPSVLTLQLGLFIAGWVLAGLAWTILKADGDGDALTHPRRHGYALWALGGFVLLRYVPGLIGSITQEPLPAELATDPAMYWLIVLMDLGIFLPAAALIGYGMIRESAWAGNALRGAVAWFALVSIAVTAMSATMIINDDPNAATAQLALFIVTGIAAVSYTYALHHPLFGRHP